MTMEWISVNAITPDIHQCVIVTDGKKVSVGFWDEQECAGAWHEIGEVTHWMPLPKAPKE